MKASKKVRFPLFLAVLALSQAFLEHGIILFSSNKNLGQNHHHLSRYNHVGKQICMLADFEVGGPAEEGQKGMEKEVRLRASHILINSEEFADTILQQIKDGKDFEELAGVSNCPSKEKGGDIGWFGMNEMVKEFEQKCLEMEEGELAKVHTQLGWHVVKLTGKSFREIDPTFEERVINRAAHILVDTEDEAKEILQKLTQGVQKFEELAKEFSKCPSSKKGGQLGWVVPGSVPPELEKALMRMEVENQLSLVQSSFGWHIVHYQGRRNKPLVIDASQMAAIVQNEDLKAQFNLIDVRESDELEKAQVPECNFEHFPLSKCNDWSKDLFEGKLLEKEKPTLCICHKGDKAAAVASFLSLELGFIQTFSVDGGIDAYAKDIDPQIPRY